MPPCDCQCNYCDDQKEERIIAEQDDRGYDLYGEEEKLRTWVAFNDPGAPTCVAAENGRGLSVNIYPDVDGAAVGVTVYTEEGVLLEAIGFLPAEVIREELDFVLR